MSSRVHVIVPAHIPIPVPILATPPFLSSGSVRHFLFTFLVFLCWLHAAVTYRRVAAPPSRPGFRSSHGMHPSHTPDTLRYKLGKNMRRGVCVCGLGHRGSGPLGGCSWHVPASLSGSRRETQRIDVWRSMRGKMPDRLCFQMRSPKRECGIACSALRCRSIAHLHFMTPSCP